MLRDMTDSACIALSERTILHLTGSDTHSLLQGIITNNVALLEHQPVIVSALLSPQGKYLHEFFLYTHPEGDGLLLETASARIDDLLMRLKRYRLRADVQFAILEDWRVYACLPDTEPDTNRINRPEHSLQVTDPRHPAMGSRLLTPYPLPDQAVHMTPEHYHHHRLQLGLPEGEQDAIPERSLMLELGYDQLGAIDFKKGCYVGQEVTARSKHRGQLRKHIHRLHATTDMPLPPFGTDIRSAGGTKLGDMRSSQGEYGLAMIRLDALEQARDAGERLLAGDSEVAIAKPEWFSLSAHHRHEI
jgi:folate-binding protein YgfZ